MGKHKEWRKLAKRERRRRIRTQIAKDRDKSDEGFLKEQQMLYTLELEMIEQSNVKENEKWLQAEHIAINKWELLQEQKKIIKQERLEKEAKKQLEYETEQKKKKVEEERLEAIREENRLKQETFMKNLEEFISGNSSDPPSELLILRETKPHAALCPFFLKTGCCRFGDMCSRNHLHPGISQVLLATNFFVHFGMDNATPSEYDTDIMLEFEEIETYKQFKEFFFDVLEEFEKFGKVVMFKVCNNFEKHLRGNVYVEYEELRCAVAAYRALHSRWYGGRQLSLQFARIKTWKNAICGQQFQKCPKGRACNFLHVFKNPNKMFVRYDTGERDKSSPSRSWRWSESPEPDIPKRSRSKDRHKDKERKKRYDNQSRFSDDDDDDKNHHSGRRANEESSYRRSKRRKSDKHK